MQRDRSFWIAWIAVAGLTWLVVVLIVLPPYVGVTGRVMIMSGFSQVCHQIADRSPQMEGIPLAVCHRCYGIYLGLAVASMFFLLLVKFEDFLGRHAGVLLVASLVPLAIDWAANTAGVYSNTAFTRTATGAIFSLMAGLFLCRAVLQLVRQKPAARP